MHKSGIVNRQIGVKNFIRVAILDSPTKGHVTAHAPPQNYHGPLCTANRPTYDITHSHGSARVL